MDIKSLSSEYSKIDDISGLFDLIQPSLYWRTDIPLSSYTTTQEDEMRIDTIFRKIYNLEENDNITVYENIDIILFINNIDNPLNIKKDMTILYPSLEDLIEFRLTPKMRNEDSFTLRDRLIVPNKNTQLDKDRRKFVENNFSIPPVVLESPRSPVTMDDRFIVIGGL